jgi:hypothetical protein
MIPSGLRAIWHDRSRHDDHAARPSGVSRSIFGTEMQP